MRKSVSCRRLWGVLLSGAMAACAGSPGREEDGASSFSPAEIVDLGAVVTEDLPERVWGRAFLRQMGFERLNSFEVIEWTFPMEGVDVPGSNAYYTLFNHGGPHVDAPIHFGGRDGIDSFPVDAFVGRAKIFDVSDYPLGRSVPPSVFEGRVEAGDIVLVFTDYAAPETEEALPELTTLTSEAAELLGNLPVKAYGTDAFSVEALDDVSSPSIHHSFLSRSIPVYEQLFNMERLLGESDLFFVGVPLNIRGGDGMLVRPVVFVQ